MGARRLIDLTRPIDVEELDYLINLVYDYDERAAWRRAAADGILQDLQYDPDMWLHVAHILSNTQNLNTKFFALQVLERAIKYRWKVLPVEERDGMKNYISDVIVKLSSDEVSFRKNRLYVNKLNVALVQILKHEWPAKWRSFIPDLVAAAKTSETICENCMAILKLLGEEVFDFSRGEMTQQKIEDLKQSMNSDIQLILELCEFVLANASQRIELMRATLAVLRPLLSRSPLGCIFESQLINTLFKFLSMPAYRNLALQCLTEIVALDVKDIYDSRFVNLYTIFMALLKNILPPDTNIPEAYAHYRNFDQDFIQNLALFFTSFFKSRIQVLESSQENIAELMTGLEYLISISYVGETEVFKVCLEFWNFLLLQLFPTKAVKLPDVEVPIPGMVTPKLLQRRQLYSVPMSKLKLLMISRMAEPEEVLIVGGENGNIVGETMKENDLVQYKIMRDTLIYLSHLDLDDIEKQMLRKLSKELTGADGPRNNLDTVCWAIGSISGCMMEEQENSFLMRVIGELLTFGETTKGGDKKAAILSNIMYVVGQYPRFLDEHWEFLKTVVNKLFGFMLKEKQPRLQEMACDAFLKIVQKCKLNFVIVQVGESEPFVSKLLKSLPAHIEALQPEQKHTFYESVGQMIQSESDSQKRDEYLQRLMELPNQKWAQITQQVHPHVVFLEDENEPMTVLDIIQINTSAASSLGTYFLPQISVIFLDMLRVYSTYSYRIRGFYALRKSYVKLLRSVRREILKLIETYLDKAEDGPSIREKFVAPLMDPLLREYNRYLPDDRESGVLSLLATIIKKHNIAMMEDVPRILTAVFQCPLEMITRHFKYYPEHGLKFFSLIRAIATHCFPALTALPRQQLKLVMDSIIWAFGHTERNIAETGLNLLFEMLKKFQASELCNQFYRTYFVTIEQEIFAVLTDTAHRPGFKLHVMVLQRLFSLVKSGSLSQPLWDVATDTRAYADNANFVREYTIQLLKTSFPNMTRTEVTQFVDGLFNLTTDASTFENHIRDFLVQSKEFSEQGNKDLS